MQAPFLFLLLIYCYAPVSLSESLIDHAYLSVHAVNNKLDQLLKLNCKMLDFCYPLVLAERVKMFVSSPGSLILFTWAHIVDGERLTVKCCPLITIGTLRHEYTYTHTTTTNKWTDRQADGYWLIEKYINVAGRNISCRNISNCLFRNNPDEKTLQIKYIEFCSRGKLSLF